MTELEATTAAMLNASDEERLEAQYRFIEILTFSSAREIMQMLSTVIAGKDFLALPVWARNLSYRLACLQEPKDFNILRQAGIDLRCFGPEWDDIADDLVLRADRIESST